MIEALSWLGWRGFCLATSLSLFDMAPYQGDDEWCFTMAACFMLLSTFKAPRKKGEPSDALRKNSAGA